MTISVFTLLAIMAFHWFADFVCQTHWQAVNKSSNNEALTRHVVVYSVVMIIPAFLFGSFVWFLINGILHWITDYYTSRVSSHFFKKQDYHNGFVIVGIDQFIHLACLVLSLKILV